MYSKQKLILGFTAEARNVSFSGTGVLGIKSRFLESLFLYPNKIKIGETESGKRKALLACGKVMPNTHLAWSSL